jgi:hypothetical protein
MNRKALALIVIALGIIYLLLAANFLHQYREVARVLATYGISESEIIEFEPIGSTRRALFGGSIVSACCGVVTLIAGAGLLLAKEWARKLWLAIATFLPLFHLFRLVADYKLGALWMAERGLELVAVSLLAVASWRVFSNARSKSALPAETAT